MTQSSVEYLTELVEPVVEAMGCELWGLEYHSSGSHRSLLRIYIEKAAGVELGDCERVSRQVSSVLDVEDPIRGEYTLEVSSPGMDRPLFNSEQYRQYIGQKVRVKLQVPYEGRRQFTGRLNGLEDDQVILLVDNDEYVLPLEGIEKAQVIPTFAETGKRSNKGKKQPNK